MSKGTVIYVGGFEFPDKNAAAHRVLNNGKIFRELGYNVVFIDIDKELKYDNKFLETKKIVNGFECWSLPYPNQKKEWLHYLSNIDYFKEIMNQYSDVKIVVAYNYQAIALMRLKKFCNKNRIKIISDCTEWYSTKGNNIIFKIIKGFDSFLRMRIIQKRLDGLIVISQYLEGYYSECKNVVRIPPLVDLSEKKWSTLVSKKYENKIRFIYAGSPGKNKDKINLLINSLYELKDISDYTFNIIGITKKQYLDNYKEHENILKFLSDRIYFYGRLSHNDSINHLKEADFSIFFREDTRLNNAGFPTKFVESISCGTPVITSKTSDLDKYLFQGVNGFWINDDLVNSFRKILLLSKDEIYSIKEKVNKEIFDYHYYIDNFELFLMKL